MKSLRPTHRKCTACGGCLDHTECRILKRGGCSCAPGYAGSDAEVRDARRETDRLRAQDDRHCATCGADILGNDPHAPDCPERPSRGTVITGAGIPLFRLLALRGAVKLEAKGIRMTRRSATAQAMKELGCKRKDVLARLEQTIAEQGAKVRPGIDIREV